MCPGDCQGHNQCFLWHRVLADAQPLQHILAKAHQKFFWQWFYLSWENLPADSAAANILQRQHGTSLLSPQGQSQRPRSPLGMEKSKPHPWPAHRAGCLAQVPATPSPAQLRASLTPVWPPWDRHQKLLAFGNKMEEESRGLRKAP